MRIVAETEGEFAGESRVELDAVQLAHAGSEQRRDCPVAGADFDDGAGGGIAQRLYDATTSVFIHEKILSEFWLTRRHSLQMLRVRRCIA